MSSGRTIKLSARALGARFERSHVASAAFRQNGYALRNDGAARATQATFAARTAARTHCDVPQMVRPSACRRREEVSARRVASARARILLFSAERSVGMYVEQYSVNALCALLCCGPIFERKADEDYAFRILDALLTSTDATVRAFCAHGLTKKFAIGYKRFLRNAFAHSPP